jgi:hypothetical protein
MTNFDHPDHANSPTSPAQMLERTRHRAEQIRRRRRRALTAIAALGVVAAIAVPVALVSGDHQNHVVGVTGAPTTVSPGPAITTAPTTAPMTVTSTTAPTIVASTLPVVTPGSTVSVPTTVSRPAAVAPCASSQLVASLANGSGAAGSVGYDLILRNSGSTTCSLLGYPGVSYVTAAFGSTVGAPARRDPLAAVTTVTLAPGKAARATVIETDSLNYPPDTCQLTTVAGLRIYPPNQTAPLFVPQSTKACANPADPVLQVGPVQH